MTPTAASYPRHARIADAVKRGQRQLVKPLVASYAAAALVVGALVSELTSHPSPHLKNGEPGEP
jgi:hypothetical protein